MHGAKRSGGIGRAGWLALLPVLFLVLQVLFLSHGTVINDIDYVRHYDVSGVDTGAAHLHREAIVTGGSADKALHADRAKAMLRYKFYSIEADEAVVLMALSRIDPGTGAFDPHFYQYGGAFLYPLGGVLYACVKAGLFAMPSLARMVADPDLSDKVYVAGRAFVLCCFMASAWFLYLALRRFAPARTAWLGTACYLFTPASVLFTQSMKPHFYALLWVNLALWLLARMFTGIRPGKRTLALLGISLGLAVGSAVHFGLFCVLVWCALVLAWRDGRIGFAPLVMVPAIALAAYLASNPYVLLNASAAASEREAASAWFTLATTPQALLLFFKNSLLRGFGIALAGGALALALARMLRPRGGLRLAAMGAGLIATAATIAVLTSALSDWYTNYRYLPYFLPGAILFLALALPRKRDAVLALCLIVGMAQTVPVFTALADENDPAHSTRLEAAAWLNANLAPGARVCCGAFAPYDCPPFDLERFTPATEACDYRVVVERFADKVIPPDGFTRVQSYTPRFNPPGYSVVHEHVNPRIDIYRRNP